jgi:hypothetical protein
MTSATLNPGNLATETQNVESAWRDLALAARNLVRALWSTSLKRNTGVPPALTAYEEANNLRALADTLVSKDLRFAQDLYAAADRHERTAYAD